MKGTSSISFKPYYPLIKYGSEKNKPYICHLIPYENGFSGEWIKPNISEKFYLCYREKQAKIMKIELESDSFRVYGLTSETVYEIYIESSSGNKSNVRLLRTEKAPAGTIVVNYLHPDDNQYIFSGKYLCSPSITRLENGKLFASMDVFGSRMPQDLTLIFCSDDDGESWHYLCDIFGFYWGLLFNKDNELYLLGLSTEYGNLKISKSSDEGKTWAVPSTIFYGSDSMCEFGGIHRAPMHFTENNGRMYTSVEYGNWKVNGHVPGVLSIDKDCDYLTPENWQITEFLSFEGKWYETCHGIKKDSIEGNIVITPDGKMQNILRWDKEKALVVDVFENVLEFNEIRDMPVSDSMFRVLKYKEKYILVSNRKPDGFNDSIGSFRRSILSLFVSDDLKEWKLIKDIINFSDKDMMKFGFQYPSTCLFENKLYILIRSSYNEAFGYHDSNTMLFTKINLEELIN